MKKVIVVIGTRPEAIKMAPVIKSLLKKEWVSLKILATAQHRQMLDQVNDFFQIKPDIDLNLMRVNQSLSGLTSELLSRADKILEEEQPDAVLVQGDTTTVMSLALASFYRKIPVGHVEAGLRTWDIYNPFPEEMNRSVVAKLAKWHFAPTENAKNNLLRDGVNQQNIYVTGNTVIDALHDAAARVKNFPGGERLGDERLVLVTSHRRENFGKPLLEICKGLKRLAESNRSIKFLYPVHPNPNVKDVVTKELAGLSNFLLTSPLSYPDFIAAMKRSYFILTDSGGVQEEAPALGKPVLVLRDETERPEAVEMGVVKIVGPHSAQLYNEAQKLLDDEEEYKRMAKGVSPYGDGKAAERISEILYTHLVK